ncbi:MAG: hypothetical protein RRY23_06090 [Alistipes sp.]
MTEIKIIYKGREYFSYKNTRHITDSECIAVIEEGCIGIPEGAVFNVFDKYPRL